MIGLKTKKNPLENGLVDTGGATKLKLQKTNVKSESKSKFQGECTQFVIMSYSRSMKDHPCNSTLSRMILRSSLDGKISHADLLVLSRLSVSYGQSFSINKEVNDCNMLEEH